MCDLKKVFDFVASCTNKDKDGRKYLEYVVYSVKNKCILGTDGRRLAVAFLDVDRFVNVAGIPAENPPEYYAANYDRAANKVILSNIDANLPNYWQVVPRYALEAAKNKKSADLSYMSAVYAGNWRQIEDGVLKYERDFTAGLYHYLKEQGVTLAPFFLNLPVFKSAGAESPASNDWQICHEYKESPVVFMNDSDNEYYKAGFRVLYLVMPYRSDEPEEGAESLEAARAEIVKAMTAAGLAAGKYRIMAGYDPTRNKCNLAVLFKVPEDDTREYLAKDFTAEFWGDVLVSVREWLKAE